jgi:hypothetical protein
MDTRILDDAPEGSVLEEWAKDGDRRDYSNVVSWVDPDGELHVEVTVDDPVYGYLIRLWRLRDDERLACTVEDDPERALETAARLAAAAHDLSELADDPSRGPHYLDLDYVEHPDLTPNPPEEWTGTEEEWEDAMKEAIEKAGTQWGKPTLTTKKIDGREYYYLQWREGDRVNSQYVAPAELTD